MKYIDAEKLKAEIDGLESFSCISEEQDGFYSAICRINDIIDSLQQEQPIKYIEINGIRYKEVPAKTGDKICKECDYFLDNGSCNFDDCPCTCADNILERIQQEQPKFKVGDTIHKIGENTVFPMTIERIYDGDYVCVTEHQQSFINIESQDNYELVEQEQPEVDLEKELENFARQYPMEHSGSYRNLMTLARHFYELGKSVRKEELPEIELNKFADKVNTFKARYKHPESISINGAMAFMARMFYQYPNVARQWYDSLPKATMDYARKEK